MTEQQKTANAFGADKRGAVSALQGMAAAAAHAGRMPRGEFTELAGALWDSAHARPS